LSCSAAAVLWQRTRRTVLAPCSLTAFSGRAATVSYCVGESAWKGHVVERATGGLHHCCETVEGELDLLFEDRLGPLVVAATDLARVEQKVAGVDRRRIAVDLARRRRLAGRSHRAWPSFHSPFKRGRPDGTHHRLLLNHAAYKALTLSCKTADVSRIHPLGTF